jgi:radical SAM protein with 4Fe4S-binding SPASM domain
MPAAEANLSLPKNLYLEVTNRCNLKCKACILYRGGWEPPRDLTLEELVMITDQLPELEQIALHGIGEPLLNEDLPSMIRHLKKRKAFVLFNSNGILLDDRRQYELIAAGLDELRISLDAASPQGYKAIRNNDKFDQIVGNLQVLVGHMKRHQVTHPKVSLWYLGTRDTIAELPQFVRLAAAIGINEVYLQRLVYFQDDDGYGAAKPEKTLVDSDGRTLEFIHRSQNLAEQFGIQFNASGLGTPLDSIQANAESRPSWKKCFRPKTLMYITSNGNVLPCCISPFSTSDYASITLGNVFESTLKEIWFGSKYKKFRKTHQTDTPPKSCQGCGVLWSL